MYASKKHLRAVAIICLLTGFLLPDSVSNDSFSIGALRIALMTSGIVLSAMAEFFVAENYFPNLGPEIFADRKDYEEWRKYAKTDDEYSKVVWWAFNLPPEQFLHFVRLVVELRYTADQQGMTSVAEYLRGQDK